jgi:catechol 2,3-dioxygenase
MTPLEWQGQLAAIALRVADVEHTASFYEDVVGMVRAPESARDRAELGWGLGTPVLRLSAGAPALEHFALEVPDPGELDRLLSRLQDHGVHVRELREGVHTVADPDGRELRLHGRVGRPGEHVADTGRRPIRLQHITLATDAMAEVLNFYREAMGMRLSDRMGDHFAWLRCGREHHTIAVINNPSATMIDHFSFDVAGWQDFREWGDRLAVTGVDVAWGPGRHGPGNNLFIMFDDPDSFHVELSAEMELFYDDRVEYEPRVWETSARTVNLWGQVPSWRSAQPVA